MKSNSCENRSKSRNQFWRENGAGAKSSCKISPAPAGFSPAPANFLQLLADTLYRVDNAEHFDTNFAPKSRLWRQDLALPKQSQKSPKIDLTFDTMVQN
jgi:hypothetical protein